MLHIPIVGVAIIFSRIIPPALAAGKSGRVRLNPIAIGILRPDMAFVLAENIFVVGGSFQKQLIIGIIIHIASQLRRAPIIVTLRERDGHGLTAFETVNLRNGFGFAGLERRQITVFIEEIVER